MGDRVATNVSPKRTLVAPLLDPWACVRADLIGLQAQCHASCYHWATEGLA